MTNLKEFSLELWRRQRLLTAAGLGFVVLLLLLMPASLFDSQQILGINRWIKPMKFAASILILLWTLAIYLYFLPPGREKAARLIGRGVMWLMTGEMVLLLMQAWRGTTSHFNTQTPFDGAVFSAMGFLILVNTLLFVYLTVLYFRDFRTTATGLPRAIIWGLRLGLVIFLLASIEGGYMSAQTGHAVGAADGGAGLPLINWSVEAGDLRVAHFVGMHALQALPLFALMLVHLQKRFAAAIRATALTVAFSLTYAAAFTLVFVQALKGKPLLLPLGREMIVTHQTSRGDGKNP